MNTDLQIPMEKVTIVIVVDPDKVQCNVQKQYYEEVQLRRPFRFTDILFGMIQKQSIR